MTLVYCFDPVEVYVSSTLEGSVLARTLYKRLNIEVIALPRQLFNETRGEMIYKTARRRTETPDIDKKYLALQALSAVQKHSEQKHNCLFILECFMIEYFQPESFMRLDYSTLMQLEVVLTKKGTVRGSLSSLFHPITQGGE